MKLLPFFSIAAVTALLTFSIINFIEIYKAKSTPEEYHFGSESMISAGGPKYQGLESYSSHNLQWGLISLFLAVALLFFLLRKKSAN